MAAECLYVIILTSGRTDGRHRGEHSPSDGPDLPQPQSFAISGQFQIPTPHDPALLVRPHRALPIDRAGRRSSVIFLIVEQGFKIDFTIYRAPRRPHRAADP